VKKKNKGVDQSIGEISIRKRGGGEKVLATRGLKVKRGITDVLPSREAQAHPGKQTVPTPWHGMKDGGRKNSNKKKKKNQSTNGESGKPVPFGSTKSSGQKPEVLEK